MSALPEPGFDQLSVETICAVLKVDAATLMADVGPHDATHPLVLALADRQDCNAADTAAKRIPGAPADFSFSPMEVARFVRGPRPHAKHIVNEGIALRRWKEARAQHERRRRFIERALREHFAGRMWFQGPYYGHLDDSRHPIYRVMPVKVADKCELIPAANDVWPPPIAEGPTTEEIPFDPFPEKAAGP